MNRWSIRLYSLATLNERIKIFVIKGELTTIKVGHYLPLLPHLPAACAYEDD